MTSHTAVLANEVQELAENERLNDAVSLLGDTWRGPLVYPNVPQDDPLTKAEMLTAVGDLTSRVGYEQQIAGSQEHAKNLLSEAISLFEDAGADTSNAQLRLAVTYLREGAHDECRVLLDQARPSTDRLRATKSLVQAILHQIAGRPHSALNTLDEAAPFFENIKMSLRGKFHLQRGLALRDVGETDRSIIEFQAASVHFESANNTRYLAAVRVNRSGLFLSMNDNARALELVDRALRGARAARAKSDIAACSETKARILLKLGRLKDAKQAVDEAVGIFKQGDEHSQLAEALITQGRILARLGYDALPVFEDALTHANVGDSYGIANACLAMIEELSLSYFDRTRLYERADHVIKSSERPDLMARLRKCARKIIYFVPETFSDVASMNLTNEARAIDNALIKSNGSVRGAAKILGTTHAAVRYHLKNNPNAKAKRNPPSKKSFIK